MGRAMAHHFREPERRQAFLLPDDMMDWLPEGDIVHLIVDAVAMMDLGWRGAWIGTSKFSGFASVKNAFGVGIGIVHTATNTI